jgi:hypothetical protein
MVGLLMHMRRIDFMADVAATTALAPDDDRAVRVQLVFDAGAALLLLLNTTLSVYKPRGLTRYGQRRLRRGTVGVGSSNRASGQQRPHPKGNDAQHRRRAPER